MESTPLMRPCEAMVFDLDGTLVDSAADILDALNYALRLARRSPMDAPSARRIISVGMEKMVELALGESGRTLVQPELGRLQGAAMRHYEANLLRRTKPYPGAEEFLRALEARGVRLGVCTNKLTGPSNRVLGELRLDRYFEVVIGRDSGPHRKPHPGPLLAAAAALQTSPRDTIFVGDSEVDVECAKAAGVRVAVMRHGYSAGDADALGADLVVDDFPSLGAALEALQVPGG